MLSSCLALLDLSLKKVRARSLNLLERTWLFTLISSCSCKRSCPTPTTLLKFKPKPLSLTSLSRRTVLEISFFTLLSSVSDLILPPKNSSWSLNKTTSRSSWKNSKMNCYSNWQTPKEISWMTLLWLKTLSTLKRLRSKSVKKSKLQKSPRLKLTRLQNFIALLHLEEPWSSSCYQISLRSTPSTNILWKASLMWSIGPSIRSLKEWMKNRTCLSLTLKEKLSYLKINQERKVRRKQLLKDKPRERAQLKEKQNQRKRKNLNKLQLKESPRKKRKIKMRDKKTKQWLQKSLKIESYNL